MRMGVLRWKGDWIGSIDSEWSAAKARMRVELKMKDIVRGYDTY